MFLTGSSDRSCFNDIQIYKSTDGVTFMPWVQYIPSLVDTNYDYYDTGDAALSYKNGQYWLFFQANRIPKGDGPVYTGDVSIYYAISDGSMSFGAPIPCNFGANAPRTWHGSNPPAGGEYAMRIDPNLYFDNDTKWLMYVWFDGGNHTAMINWTNPTAIVRLRNPEWPMTGGPYVYTNYPPDPMPDEGIKEGSNIFKRNGIYYYLYGSGWFNGAWCSHYMMSKSVAAFNQQQIGYQLSYAKYSRNGTLLENTAHGTVVNWNSRYYLYYYVMNTDTWERYPCRRELRFNDDGTIKKINAIDISWDSLPNREYSLDFHQRGQPATNWIAAAINAGIINRTNRITYTGVCWSDNNRLLQSSEIDKIRLAHIPLGGNWQNDASYVTVNVPPGEDRVHIPLGDNNWIVNKRSWSLSTRAYYAGGTNVVGDFDGDSHADFGMYHANEGLWLLNYSTLGNSNVIRRLGVPNSVPVVGDFDGDGKDDIGCYRATDGYWKISMSSNGLYETQFGYSPTVPVIADYNGDGKSDKAIYEAANGAWHIIYSGSNAYTCVMWGWSAAVPVPADYDGDGRAEIATYEYANGRWSIRYWNLSNLLLNFGWSESIPVPAIYPDESGVLRDNMADIAVYYPPSGSWIIRKSDGNQYTRNFGYSGTRPVPANYDGVNNGVEVGVYIP